MTSISKKVYIDKLDNIVNKYNNTYHSKYHSTIKMKSVDLKPKTYTDSGKENNKEDSKFEVVDNVRMSKYRNIFATDYTSN